MTRDELLALLSRVDPRIADAVLSGQIPLEEFLRQYTSTENSLLGFDITRTQISDNQYFEHNRTEIVDEQGQLGTIRNYNVWHCGHNQKTHELGGIDSFGHVVCIMCMRFCDIGRHPCCVMDSSVLPSGLIACDCHRGIWRFFNSKFERERIR